MQNSFKMYLEDATLCLVSSEYVLHNTDITDRQL